MNNKELMSVTKETQRKPLPKKRSLTNTKQLKSLMGGAAAFTNGCPVTMPQICR